MIAAGPARPPRRAMRRRLSLLVLAPILGVGGLGSRSAESGDPMLVDTYVFKGGEGVARVLVAAAVTGLVTPESNPNSLALGVVMDADPNCGAKHFVGVFQGQQTPENDSGSQKYCGFGKLSLVPVGPNALRSYATAWTATEGAHRVLLGLRDLGGATHEDARAEITTAIVALSLLDEQLGDLKSNGTITKDERQAIGSKLDAAIERLGLASAGLLALIAKPGLESRKATLAYFVVIRQLVLAEDRLVKVMQKMEQAGLVPGASG
jgi:hypothetical protein